MQSDIALNNSVHYNEKTLNENNNDLMYVELSTLFYLQTGIM